MRFYIPLCTTLLALALPAFSAVEMEESADKVRVEIDGQLFTEYCFTGAPHVYFYRSSDPAARG